MATILATELFRAKSNNNNRLYGAATPGTARRWTAMDMTLALIRVGLWILALVLAYYCTRRTPTSTLGTVLTWVAAILVPELFLIYALVRKIVDPKFCSSSGLPNVGARKYRVGGGDGGVPVYINPKGSTWGNAN